MTLHAVKRCQERYNIYLSKRELDNVIMQVLTSQAIYIGKAKGSKTKKLYYAKVNNIPIKVLCNWADFRIISVFPFDTDEYNLLRDKKRTQKEIEAIALLNRLGYNIENRFKVDEDKMEIENMLLDVKEETQTISCPSCGVTYSVVPQHINVVCQDCGYNYHQYSRTIKTDKWIGDFIERCKGG